MTSFYRIKLRRLISGKTLGLSPVSNPTVLDSNEPPEDVPEYNSSFKLGSNAIRPLKSPTHDDLFYKTSFGKVIIVLSVVLLGLLVLGGLACLLYYLLAILPYQRENSFKNEASLMTNSERESLIVLGKFKDLTLLYRASRDGFSLMEFHKRCDNIPHTVSVIRSTADYVFGGYTSNTWDATAATYKNDSNAFIFSLRRDGISTSGKFPASRQTNNIYTRGNYGPTFGDVNHDIYICDRADHIIGSYSNFGNSFVLPNGINFATPAAREYLAGTFHFLVTDIEVYQVTV